MNNFFEDNEEIKNDPWCLNKLNERLEEEKAEQTKVKKNFALSFVFGLVLFGTSYFATVSGFDFVGLSTAIVGTLSNLVAGVMLNTYFEGKKTLRSINKNIEIAKTLALQDEKEKQPNQTLAKQEVFNKKIQNKHTVKAKPKLFKKSKADKTKSDFEF